MKKVKKYDLLTVLSRGYTRYVNFSVSPVEIIDREVCVDIEVNSIYIAIIDRSEFDSEKAQEARMHDFAKYIEAITFGNLKVVYTYCEIDGNYFFSYVEMASAYEIVGL